MAAQPIFPSVMTLLRERAEEFLVDDAIPVFAGDAIGGGNECSVTACTQIAETQLCVGHYERWRSAGRPVLADWDPGSEPVGFKVLSLGGLPVPLKWELAYAIALTKEDPDPPTMRLTSIRNLIHTLETSGVTSLMEHPETDWPISQNERTTTGTMKLSPGLLTYTIDAVDQLHGRGGIDDEYHLDTWRVRRIRLHKRTNGTILRFTEIDRPWLRDAVKQFIKWRNETEYSITCMQRDVITLTRLSTALRLVAGPHATPSDLDRTVIDRFLTLLVEDGLTPNGRNIALSSITRFLSLARQHSWISGVPSETALYDEDFPKRTPLAPRGIAEFVMVQLESPGNLDKLTDPRWRLLIPLLMETGLRITDALHLGQDCIVRDHQNAPYLRYYNRKMKREALVPITEQLEHELTVRISAVHREHGVSGILFPREKHNFAGAHPINSSQTFKILNDWTNACDIRNEHGHPVHITAHQFRHTLGTRLINNDVPQEVVRKILDHSSTEMTAHYARLHDDTVRRHWERARKVDIHGHAAAISDTSVLADAAWTKHHLGKVTAALPNGYCGLPLQKSCPHSNACLTCAVFVTTAEFLPQHREQLDHTRGIIERAEKYGQLRLIEMNTKVAENLSTIITALETTEPTPDGDQDAR